MRRAETRTMILRDDFWTKIDELPASGCAATARFDDELAIHAEFFRDLKCFNGREQVDPAKQLIHELERLTAADCASVDNFLSHRVQKRSNELQIFGAGTDHKRQGALARADVSAGDRRVHKPYAGFAEFLHDCFRLHGTDCAVVHYQGV
jgi:hypothetical protein